MNKKLFGIKISTYLQAFVCLVLALGVWIFAKYVELNTTEETVSGVIHGFLNI